MLPRSRATQAHPPVHNPPAATRALRGRNSKGCLIMSPYRTTFVVAALCLLLTTTRPTAQDAAPPPKLAVINQVKVINAMQETKDLAQAMTAHRQQVEAEHAKRADEVNEAVKRRGLYEEGTA